jgi:hypothetical protein
MTAQHLLSQLAEREIWETVIKSNGHYANIACPLAYGDENIAK